MSNKDLQEIVNDYLGIFPGEQEKLGLLKRQLRDNEVLNSRKNFNGHITAGGIVFSPDNKRVLLVHHRIFNKWFQPAGHWDPEDADPLEAARREVVEETGVHLAKYLSIFKDQPLVPIDIDTHAIPENSNKHEAAHYHHDFRYVFVAQDENLSYQEAEVDGAVWLSVDDPQVEHIRDVIEKVRRLKLIPS